MEELIIQEYLDGNSITKILQKYPQYNRRAINKLFADNNIAIRGGRKKKTLTQEQIIQVKKMIDEGAFTEKNFNAASKAIANYCRGLNDFNADGINKYTVVLK